MHNFSTESGKEGIDIELLQQETEGVRTSKLAAAAGLISLGCEDSGSGAFFLVPCVMVHTRLIQDFQLGGGGYQSIVVCGP